MPKLLRDDFILNYEVTIDGDGPTVLLIAGLGEQIGAVEYRTLSGNREYWLSKIPHESH